MLNILINLILIGILCFGFVVLFGAPYLPTLKKQKIIALDMLNLKKGQTLLELGCGDGRMLKEAAKRGLLVYGYELNPILFVVSKLNTIRYRKNIVIKLGNFWVEDWPKYDGIYVFLTVKYMHKLDKKILQNNHKNIKLLSYASRIPNKKAISANQGMFLYKY